VSLYHLTMTPITYTDSLDGITSTQLTGFFVGWPNPPSPEAHLRMLKGSSHILLALSENRVVGFITAISDGVSAAYIPHLEVLPDYQGQGIGTELVRRMLATLSGLYMVDLMCDPDLQPFYRRFGMHPSTGMFIRNYDRQSCN
jgi:ribosomal protein S18 acetylase RimI-like enzyme